MWSYRKESKPEPAQPNHEAETLAEYHRVKEELRQLDADIEKCVRTHGLVRDRFDQLVRKQVDFLSVGASNAVQAEWRALMDRRNRLIPAWNGVQEKCAPIWAARKKLQVAHV